MIFKSIEEIRKHFGLTKDSIEEIRKELLGVLAEYHPDKTGGSFANKIQERNYEETNNALEFIDESQKDTNITKQELSIILKKIEDLSIITSAKIVETFSEDKITEKLNGTIKESIIQFHKRQIFPKISSLAISGLITILWTFPGIASDHPVLKNYGIINSPLFTMFWFSSLLMTAFIWIVIKNQESLDEQIKKRFSFDSTQGSIFKLFICWIQIANPKSRDYKNPRMIITFTKDELINFPDLERAAHRLF